MSEQEKKEQGIIEGEGVVTDAPAVKESKIKKWINAHPKAVKWAKRIGIGACWIGTTALAYLVGAGAKGTAETMSALTESTTEDEDEELEEPAEE